MFIDLWPSLLNEVQRGNDERTKGWGILQNCLCMKCPPRMIETIVRGTASHACASMTL